MDYSKLKIPNHVALIVDGNGRWATEKGMNRSAGHKQGFLNLKKLTAYIFSKNIKCISAYLFSTENFKRSQMEVSFIMGLLTDQLQDILNFCHEEKIKAVFSGRKEHLSDKVLKAINKIFEDLQRNLIDIQQELIKAVTYIYNLDNNKALDKYTYAERFAVYLIKRMGKLYSYYKNDYIMRDSYSRKYDEFSNNSEYEILESLHTKNMLLSMSDTHKSNDLSSICYAILEELSKTSNYPIKKCQNCGMYFIPTSKVDEIYCDYPKESSKSCRDLGAFQSYTERLKNNKAMGEYRRTYQQKFMQVRKDKNNTKLSKDFETWKKKAKEKINDMKKGKLTENEVYEWILKNKIKKRND